ncbi:MAG: type II secretion system protein [Fimbriimonas sp.]|nr:type II secretion system protein [Fimbriimonas sp.]
MGVRRAFSLLELLVVIGILLVLAALLFPVFSQAKQRAKLTNCQTRLHQVAYGMQMYRGDYDGEAWIEYTDFVKGCSTTAGRCSYPYDSWIPIAPYVKSGNIVWCPEPDRSEIMSYNLFNIRKIAKPAVADGDKPIEWHPLEPEAGRVVAFCDNHATDEFEKPDPKLSSMVELWKGNYPAVRDDGSVFLAKSSQIELWYYWPDSRWHPTEQGAKASSQLWRFPNEPWPPTVPWF